MYKKNNFYIKKFGSSTYGWAPSMDLTNQVQQQGKGRKLNLDKTNQTAHLSDFLGPDSSNYEIFDPQYRAETRQAFRDGHWLKGTGRSLNDGYRKLQGRFAQLLGGRAGFEAWAQEYAKRNPGETQYEYLQKIDGNKATYKAKQKALAAAQNDPRVQSGQMTADEVLKENIAKSENVFKWNDRIDPATAQSKIKEIQQQIADGTITGDDQIAWAKKEIEDLQNKSQPLTREEQIQKDRDLDTYYGDAEANARAVRDGTATPEQVRNHEDRLEAERRSDPEKFQALRAIATSAKSGETRKPGQLSTAEAQFKLDTLNLNRQDEDRRAAYKKDMEQYNNGMKQLNALREQIKNTTDPKEKAALSRKAMAWDLSAQKRREEIEKKHAINTADMTPGQRAKVRSQQETRNQVAAERAASGTGPQAYNEAAINFMKNRGYSDNAIAKTIGGGVNDQKALWDEMDENTRKATGWNYGATKQPNKTLTPKIASVSDTLLGAGFGGSLGYLGNAAYNLLNLTNGAADAYLAMKRGQRDRANEIAKKLLVNYKEPIMEAIRTDLPRQAQSEKFIKSILKSPLKNKSRLALFVGIPALLNAYAFNKLNNKEKNNYEKSI